MNRLTIYIIVAPAFLYLVSYAILRISGVYITTSSIAGGVYTEYIIFNFEKHHPDRDKVNLVLSVDAPPLSDEVENSGLLWAFTPLRFAEEKIRGIGRTTALY